MLKQLSPYPQIHQQNGQNASEAPLYQPTNTEVVRLERITKRFKNIYALRNVSLRIQQGEIFGLLGAKGAGKSTLTKLLLGFLHPDGGTIQLFGSPDIQRARARIGYLPESAHYHRNFTARQYLQFHARLAGLSGRPARALVERVLEAVDLAHVAGRLIRGYHRDMRQRLGLAVALVSAGGRPPELLILDEPASGLDHEGRLMFRDIILECQRNGSTVLICSHQLSEIERTCTSVGILRAGRLITQTHLDDSPRVNILGIARNGAIDILPYLVEYLQNLHPAVTIRGGRSEDEPLMVSLPTGPAVANSAAIKAAALRALVDGRWDIMSVHIENKDLESLYMLAVPSHAHKDEGEGKPDQSDADHPGARSPITEPLAAGGEVPAGGSPAGASGTAHATGTQGQGRATEPLPSRPSTRAREQVATEKEAQTGVDMEPQAELQPLPQVGPDRQSEEHPEQARAVAQAPGPEEE
jgi:ABC-2 type transport system ATP-binding protein